jgi:hypothetical protein
MVAITALRSTLATALSNEGVWSVFSFPPASPIANSVIIQPDDPYVEPQNNSYNTIAPLAHFKIVGIVPMFDNQGNLADIESYMVQIFNKLSTSGLSFNISALTAPSVLPVDAGQMLSSELSISILTTWS